MRPILAGWVSVLLFAAPASPRAAAPSPTYWTKQVGACRLIKWSHSVPDREQRETLSVRDAAGREVARVREYGITIAPWRDAPRHEEKVVWITTWTGGAHSAMCYYLYALGPEPRCLLAYGMGNAYEEPDPPDFEARDLDGDGVPEILTWYDGFLWWDAPYKWSTCFACDARIPMVLQYQHGRYVEASHRYPRWMEAQLRRVKADLREERGKKGAVVGPDEFHRMAECYCIERLLHSRETARRHVRGYFTAAERRAFREGEGEVERILARSARRFRYPRAYAATPTWDFRMER